MSLDTSAQDTTQAETEKQEPSVTSEVTPKVEPPKEDAHKDDKPETDKTKEAKDPEKKESDVPEKYDLKLPEGSLVDESRMEAVSIYAKEHKLSQESAQAILNYESKATEQLAKQNQEVWINQLRDDKEVGGTALEENGQYAYQAAERWFGPEFVDMIKQANLNNNPLLFKGLVRLHKASANGTFERSGTQGSTERKTFAEALYGSQGD